MTLSEKMHQGLLYDCSAEAMTEELQAEWLRCRELLYDFNQARPSEHERRQAILQQLLADMGENCYIESPFYANWGCHIHVGNNFYANFGFTAVDDTHIYIGDNVMLAPHVTLATATHPIAPELREACYQYNLPIHIGNRVWIGAGSIVLPGVTIGDDSVIGAGSVVTRDIPAGVVAVGHPCRVMREINEQDREYYAKGRKIDKSLLP